MRLRITKSKNVNLYYVIKTVYINRKEKTGSMSSFWTLFLRIFLYFC